MVQAMEALFEHHPDATYVGYPVGYGPRNPGPYDWTVIRRILDGRPQIVIADGGIKLESRVFSENAAAAVLLVIDNPERAAGKRYSVTDAYAFTMRQRVEFIARHIGAEPELVDMPYELAWPCHPLWRHTREHRLAQSALIRSELGYRDAAAPDDALARTVDWLISNPPEPGGELERQIGDPFAYGLEDELIERWQRARAGIGPVQSPLPEQGHQYRHPKAPGEAWGVGAR
jgi:nucleoside-diphosphate-sugar epimerase